MRRRTLLLSGLGVAGSALGIRVTGWSSDSTSEGAGSDSAPAADDSAEALADDSRARALVSGSLQTVADDAAGATVEAYGSLAAAELVQSGARDPDAIALADPALVDELAGWYATFAGNALTVVYHPDSQFADAIRDDWQTALADEEVSVGRTDPARDPLGYRTLLGLELASRDGAPAEAIRENASVFPETQLLRTLEAGGLDAAFAYRNMAVAHDLPRVELPAKYDLSDPDLANHYRTAEVTVSGETDGSETIRGEPIRYGAAFLTDRGRTFYENLVESSERLRESGFTVPERYPVERGRAESPREHGRDNR